MHLLKMCQRVWAGPSPLHSDKIQKNAFFSQETNRSLHLKIGESTSELECGLDGQPAGHGKVSALQDDDAFNSYNI